MIRKKFKLLNFEKKIPPRMRLNSYSQHKANACVSTERCSGFRTYSTKFGDAFLSGGVSRRKQSCSAKTFSFQMEAPNKSVKKLSGILFKLNQGRESLITELESKKLRD